MGLTRRSRRSDQGGLKRCERHHRPVDRFHRDGLGGALRSSGDMEVLIALAATLPRQIDMTHDVHTFTSGWNDSAGAVGAPARRWGQHAPGFRPNFDHA